MSILKPVKTCYSWVLERRKRRVVSNCWLTTWFYDLHLCLYSPLFWRNIITGQTIPYLAHLPKSAQSYLSDMNYFYQLIETLLLVKLSSSGPGPGPRSGPQVRSRSGPRSGPKGPRTKGQRPGPGLNIKFGLPLITHHHHSPPSKLFFWR